MKTNSAVAPVVQWWVDDSKKSERHAIKAARDGDLWVATLTDLPIGAHISYQVEASAGTTDVQQFRVGVAKGEHFRFGVFGDTRTGHYVHRAVIEAMARENLEFVVHTGDMVESGGVQSQWDTFFGIERPLLVKTPIVPAIGNHDMSGRQYFRHYFLHKRWTHNRRYFVHDWGNLRIVVVDGGIECQEGCEQHIFAERALADGARRGMLMAIMLHYPPYSSGAHGSQMIIRESLKPLAERYGVELVIAGHDHNYERTKLINGVTYIVSGSAGAPIRPIKPRWFTAEARTEPHYVLVDVEDDQLILRTVNLRGDTFDSAVLHDNPAQPR